MKKWASIALTSIAIFTMNNTAIACTSFRLTGTDGTILISRSMEFAMDMHSNIRNQVQGQTFTNKAPDGKPAATWKNKYGYIYLDGMNVDRAIDGMNEKGLSFEALLLPGMTEYQTVPAGKDKQAIPYLSMGDWVLGNFQSVDEVKQALANVYVYSQKLPELGEIIFPLHFSVYDRSGKSIVVEFTKGQMQIYDNDIGMMTNSPTYDWQVTNLRSYLNLTPYLPDPITSAGITFSATGQGAGSFGLPGDPSPPSRFVKTVFSKKYALAGTDVESTINLAEHLMNDVDIAVGTTRAKEPNGQESMDYTQWVVMKDLTHKVFYYRSYKDLTLRKIAMDKIDFSENAARYKMALSMTNMIVDETDDFLKSK